MGQIQMQMIDCSVSSGWWKDLAARFISPGDELEIRCWKEEPAEIEQASSYGLPQEDGYEVSIQGTVTAEFLAELLSENPPDKSVYNKMTKYFTLHVTHGKRDFWSAHYGTEVYIDGVSDDDITFFTKVIRQVSDCFSISMEK